MNPSTTARANNSSEPMRARTSGSRKRAGPGADGAVGAGWLLLAVVVFLFHHMAFHQGMGPIGPIRHMGPIGPISPISPIDRSLQSALGLRHRFDQLLDHLIGINLLGLGLEI